jgi:hypothetical protein
VTRYETYAHVAELPLCIERCELHPIVRDTTSGFTKVSIVVRLSGADHVGEGEDITWDQIDQIELLRAGADLSWLHGTRTFDEFSRLLGLANLFPVRPIRPPLPALGVRERGARPRPTPERRLVPARRRPSGTARQLRGIGPDRRSAGPRDPARMVG